MIWMSDYERAMACRAICNSIYKPHLFAGDGPTREGLRLRPGRGDAFAVLSSGERIMIRFAWDVWNGHGKFHLYDALGTLDGRNLQTLARFFDAYSSPGHEEMRRFITECADVPPATARAATTPPRLGR